jgi:hypothetical protein
MNTTPRESVIFGVPQTVDIMAVLDDGRWYSKPALCRLTGYHKSHAAGLLQRMYQFGWVERATNPKWRPGEAHGVALWKAGPYEPERRGPEHKGQPRVLYRATAIGRAGVYRARLWAMLDLPWNFIAGKPERGMVSWRVGCLHRRIAQAAAWQKRRRLAGGL